ncbi:hypothetical protein [Aquibacillus rhizosphaerae]|uniref:Uncharacterized protein n=1 Tax=Aquibacillus rhizosphaerae TaxID=3051431 RepID=A0ABT7LEY6_9BACI|nr:hypothetical protein [Aquibacillus sp. LR5S19]MDL4843126.1 hypothetical protein [Aquibacillus sp. LR5S19]
MPNYVWFLFLFIISLAIFIITIKKLSDRERLIQTFLYISGIAYIVDYVVLIVFNSYQYKPGLSESLWFDSTFGSIFSQGILVPTVAMAIAGFHLNFLWIILISVGFMGIEELFLAVDVYEHHWWKTWYTGFLLLIGFYLAKNWYQSLQKPSIFTQLVTIYMAICFYVTTLRFFMVMQFSTHYYSVGWFSNPLRDHIAGNALILFIWMIPVTIVVTVWFRWYSVLILLASEWIIDHLLIKYGYMHIAPFWHVYYFVIILLVSVLLFRFIYLQWFIKKMKN